MDNELIRLRDEAFQRFLAAQDEGEFGDWLLANGQSNLFDRLAEAECKEDVQ